MTPARLFSIAVLAGLLVVAAAGPALAHGRGSDTTNYLSILTDDPAPEGVTWEVVNSDEYLQVTNTGDDEVLVLDYEGEPYARIGPDGVFTNRNSRATYINEDRFGENPPPTDIDPQAEPDWQQVSDANAFAWHDHRIHWMDTRPPAVVIDEGIRTLVNEWSVPFEVAGTGYELRGELYWVPGGSPWVWLLPALLVLGIPVALVLLRTRADAGAGEWPALARVAGGILLVLAVANSVNLVDDFLAGPGAISQKLVAGIQTLLFVGVGLFGAVVTIKGKDGAFTALAVGVAAIFVGQGLLYLSVLSTSQTASVFPDWLTRAVVAASVAQVIPLGIAAVRGNKATAPPRDAPDAPDVEPEVATT